MYAFEAYQHLLYLIGDVTFVKGEVQHTVTVPSSVIHSLLTTNLLHVLTHSL